MWSGPCRRGWRSSPRSLAASAQPPRNPTPHARCWTSSVHRLPTRPSGATACNQPKEGIAMIIDIHGHYTTAPAALGAWRDLQIASLKDPGKAPKSSDLKISDDELRESIETNQLAKM